MTSKKRQKLTFCLETEVKDFFGVYEVGTQINGKNYTFYLSSEYILRKVKSLVYRRKVGRALNLLKEWNLKEVTYEKSNDDNR